MISRRIRALIPAALILVSFAAAQSDKPPAAGQPGSGGMSCPMMSGQAGGGGMGSMGMSGCPCPMMRQGGMAGGMMGQGPGMGMMDMRGMAMQAMRVMRLLLQNVDWNVQTMSNGVTVRITSPDPVKVNAIQALANYVQALAGMVRSMRGVLAEAPASAPPMKK